MWNIIGGVGELRAKWGANYYQSLVESKYVPDQDIRGTIERDINRTYPSHAMFAISSGEEGGQGCLRRVLRAYSLHDEEVGYCQGMGFIVAMFLTYMEVSERSERARRKSRVRATKLTFVLLARLPPAPLKMLPAPRFARCRKKVRFGSL